MNKKQEILESAKRYKELHPNCTFNDYEYFKSLLHEAGIFGCEAELASILDL